MAYNASAYCDMHVIGASISIVVGAANTWYAIPNSLLSSDHLGWTLSSGNTLTCNSGAGTYAITLSATVSCGSANQAISLTYTQGGTASTNVQAACELVNSGRTYCLSCTDIQTFADGDTVTIVLQNNTAANNLTVVNVSMTLVRIR